VGDERHAGEREDLAVDLHGRVHDFGVARLRREVLVS